MLGHRRWAPLLMALNMNGASSIRHTRPSNCRCMHSPPAAWCYAATSVRLRRLNSEATASSELPYVLHVHAGEDCRWSYWLRWAMLPTRWTAVGHLERDSVQQRRQWRRCWWPHCCAASPGERGAHRGPALLSRGQHPVPARNATSRTLGHLHDAARADMHDQHACHGASHECKAQLTTVICTCPPPVGSWHGEHNTDRSARASKLLICNSSIEH